MLKFQRYPVLTRRAGIQLVVAMTEWGYLSKPVILSAAQTGIATYVHFKVAIRT